jgi:gliding motility-associated-like protein
LNSKIKILILSFTPLLWRGAGGEVIAQPNLVNNYSFEDYNICPDGGGQICRANYWFQTAKTISPDVCQTIAGSDYYNSCSLFFPQGVSIPQNFAGYQYPRSVEAYTGAILYNTIYGNYYRDYVEGSLSEPLRAGKKYCVSFFVSLAEMSDYSVDRIGCYFTNDSLFGNGFEYINVIPHVESPEVIFLNDTLNWMELSGIYIAQGGERFITIGNFRDSLETNLQVTNFGIGQQSVYYYIDDVAVWYCDEDESVSEDLFVPNAFSPNADGNNDTLKVLGKGIAEIEFAIYNRWGELIFKTHDAKQGWDGTYKGEKSEPAVYAWYVKARMRNGKEIFKKGNVTLIR